MTSCRTSHRALFRPVLLVGIILVAVIVTRYFVSIRVPGPMRHPIKYRIISGAFRILLELTRLLEAITGIPHYASLNAMVNFCDSIKIRYFDRGQVLYEDTYIEDVLVRIYTPTNVSNASLTPLIVFFHGGGFFFGSIYSHDTMTYHLSMYTGAKIIAVNYHLSPNVRYPTAIEESIKVTRHVMDNYQNFAIDPDHVFLCGDSAGGNMAVVVEHHLREQNKPRVRGVILLYPLLQLVNFRLPSYLTYLPYRLLSIIREDVLVQVPNFYLNTSFSTDDLFKNRHLSHIDYERFYSKLNFKYENDDQARQYLSEISHPDVQRLFDPNVSPLLADDNILRASPPTFIVACDYDVLLSDAQLYFHRLEQLHVSNVIYRSYRIFHGTMTFVDFPVGFNEAFDILSDSAQFVINSTKLIL